MLRAKEILGSCLVKDEVPGEAGGFPHLHPAVESVLSIIYTGHSVVKNPFALKNREEICRHFKEVVLPHTLRMFYCLCLEDN